MAEPTTNHTMRAASRAWIGASGVAACNIEVASLDEVPALAVPKEELVVAQRSRGTCHACQVDMDEQYASLPPDAPEDAEVLPNCLPLKRPRR